MRIILNGEAAETAAKTVFALYGDKSDDTVVILNGYQLAEDYPLSPDDEVYVINKGVMPPQEQLEKMMAARHTPKVH